jgi:hypothetical protein
MSMDDAELMNCPARITLDAAQQTFLDGLPAAAPAVRSELGCELERGHDGSHAALAEQVGETMWWAQWTLSASEINPYTWCPVKRDRPAVEPECSLFDGHPGRHTSEERYWVSGDAA